MAKLVYHLMTDRELKKRVAEAGLPTKGDRKVRELGKRQDHTLRFWSIV